MHDHLVSHIQHPELRSNNTLHCVVVISNPVRYHSRYRLARQCIEALERTPHVKVYVVEIAFGDREFEVTECGRDNHLQLRTKHELWHKENMINLGVRHLLPRDWRYMAWIDGDVFWPDNGWALETIHQLQHHSVVQPWQSCLDLGFYGQVLQTFESFCYVHRLGVPKQCHPSQPYKYAHTGFAWACTREFWENIKGLMDWCIVGSADHHQAWAMINQVHLSVHGQMPESFKRKAREWQEAAYRITQGSLGFVKTRIEHKFHGKKRNRQYRERWQIFIDHAFNPDTDIAYDSQGLLCVRGKAALEDDIRNYMRARQEDEISEY